MQIPGELDLFRKEFEELVKPLSEKHGINIDVGAFSYNVEGTSFSFKGTVANVSEETKGLTARQIKYNDFYKKACELYGLKPEWLGEEFIAQGKSFKIIGINSRASKRPICCISEGTEYGFPQDSVKVRMNAVEANKKNA